VDGTLKQSEISTVDTAILLASSGVFDSAAAERSPVGALTCVGGMTLFQRTLCTLQRGGIAHVLILVGEEERALRSLVHGDDRLRMVLRWLSVREFPPLHAQTWEALTGEMNGACLILGCHIVFFPSLIVSLRKEGRTGHAVVPIGQPGDRGDAHHGRRWRFDFHRDGQPPRVTVADRGAAVLDSMAEEASGLASAVDLVVLPVRFFRTSGRWGRSATGAMDPIRLALERAALEGAVRVLSLAPHGYQDVRETDGPRNAERMLFQALQVVQGSLDGVMDRYVNRKLSRLCSRFFLRLRCPPTVITVLSLMVGLTGAACFAMGSYWLDILGAVLFQVAVIFDCCDGEVARLTFAESRVGQVLDIVADNIVHMAIFAGVAWGVAQNSLWQSSSLSLIVGAVAIVSTGVALWCVQRVKSLKAQSRSWQSLSLTLRSRVDGILERVANRDFSVVVAVCACLGILPWFLWLGAVGASVFAVLMAWNLRQALRSRQS